VKRSVAITGAGGFLGTELCRQLLAVGMKVHALSRRPPTLPGVEWQAYDLADPAPVLPAGVDAVVHAAFAMGPTGPGLEALNETAAHRLQSAARERGAHFIFISSMSAHAAAASSYGRAKWRIEQTLDPDLDTIVRPGLIVGSGGVYARMMASLRRAPFLPLFYGGTQPVQPVGLDEVTNALRLIVAGRLPGTYNLGSPEPITMREFYRRMMLASGTRRPVVPLPGNLTVWLLRAGESLGLRLPLTAENLLGQKYLRSFETSDSQARLGLAPQTLDQLPWILPPSPNQ